MKRAGLIFVGCLTFGLSGVHKIAAQAAGPVIPQAPAHAQMPVPKTVPASPPQVANKPATPSRSVQPAITGNPSNQTAKEPVQTKIVRIYRGDGYFDVALAEKLGPVLSKNSELAPSSNRLASADLLRAILGAVDDSRNRVFQKSVDQKPVAETGGL
jgi:hypothetical protein